MILTWNISSNDPVRHARYAARYRLQVCEADNCILVKFINRRLHTNECVLRGIPTSSKCFIASILVDVRVSSAGKGRNNLEHVPDGLVNHEQICSTTTTLT